MRHPVDQMEKAPQEAVWETIRALGIFTLTEVVDKASVNRKTARDYLKRLTAGGEMVARFRASCQYRYCKTLYKTRNLVERCFNRLKDWRSLSLRTFRCRETFLAAAHLAAIVIWYL